MISNPKINFHLYCENFDLITGTQPYPARGDLRSVDRDVEPGPRVQRDRGHSGGRPHCVQTLLPLAQERPQEIRQMVKRGRICATGAQYKARRSGRQSERTGQ